MKISSKHKIALGTGIFGLFAGIAITSGGFRNSLAKTISIAGGAAIPAIFLTHLIVDTRAQSKINDAEGYVEELDRELEQANKQLGDSKARLASFTQEYEGYKRQSEELNQELTSQLNLTKQCLIACDADKNRAIELITQLQSNIKVLEAQASKDREQINYLASEIEQWELNFHSLVDAESDKKFKTARANEIQKIFDEHDAITQEAMALFRQLQSWGEKVAHGHNSKREIIRSLATVYNGNLDEIQKAVEQERATYLEQIELLNEKVGRLQQELAGELLEPTYGNFGFDVNGKVANAIAYDIWQSYKIPLIVNGFEEHEESVSVGYGFSRTLDIQNFLKLLDRESKNISSRLGIFLLYDVKAEKISPTISLKFRRERPKPLNDDEIYKLGLIPASQFGDRVFLHTDHKTKGKPTLRIMSATGGGKGIATKNIVAYFLTLDNWEIWVSDPLDGSEEDYWHCPKISTSPKESAQAYSAFVKLHKDRQAKRPAMTDKFVLGIFDEFDKQHDDDDKKSATEIMTAIRHTKQRQILIGQSGEVGENRWTWDAMKNCSLLFIEDAIATAIKHDKDLGWSLAKKREIQRKYEKFAQWAAAKNESQNLSSENAYRIGLIIVGDRYEFLEIPSAHKGILRNGVGIIRESLTIYPETSSSDLSAIKNDSSINSSQEIECPHCHSAEFTRNKSVKNPLMYRYKCKNCEKTFIAPNNKITSSN
ncbi:hypothetical protein H6G33_36270 [Calothrix sp. FACHB-1219]|nr:hypothetical protein [Calothrix sp. FACHB-168]MBD2222388.1 hypothetical protein [Calothrix sp. FACHB-1219]